MRWFQCLPLLVVFLPSMHLFFLELKPLEVFMNLEDSPTTRQLRGKPSTPAPMLVIFTARPVKDPLDIQAQTHLHSDLNDIVQGIKSS